MSDIDRLQEIGKTMQRAMLGMAKGASKAAKALSKADDCIEECPRCGGDGEIVLLVSRVECQRCGGEGRVVS